VEVGERGVVRVVLCALRCGLGESTPQGPIDGSYYIL